VCHHFYYCTISTVSSVTRNGQKKSPCFKSLELKRKFIGHLGQQIFRIHELTVEMVQYFVRIPQGRATRVYLLARLCSQPVGDEFQLYPQAWQIGNMIDVRLSAVMLIAVGIEFHSIILSSSY
jgi:hypothetical protein